MTSRMHVDIDSSDPFERGRQRGAQVGARLQQTWPIYQSLFAVTARDAGRDPVDVPPWLMPASMPCHRGRRSCSVSSRE